LDLFYDDVMALPFVFFLLGGILVVLFLFCCGGRKIYARRRREDVYHILDEARLLQCQIEIEIEIEITNETWQSLSEVLSVYFKRDE
jgi:hypothetical protein